MKTLVVVVVVYFFSLRFIATIYAQQAFEKTAIASTTACLSISPKLNAARVDLIHIDTHDRNDRVQSPTSARCVRSAAGSAHGFPMCPARVSLQLQRLQQLCTGKNALLVHTYTYSIMKVCVCVCVWLQVVLLHATSIYATITGI